MFIRVVLVVFFLCVISWWLFIGSWSVQNIIRKEFLSNWKWNQNLCFYDIVDQYWCVCRWCFLCYIIAISSSFSPELWNGSNKNSDKVSVCNVFLFFLRMVMFAVLSGRSWHFAFIYFLVSSKTKTKQFY